MFSEEWRGILQHFHSHLQSGKVGEGAGTPSRRASEPGGGWASLQQEEGRGAGAGAWRAAWGSQCLEFPGSLSPWGSLISGPGRKYFRVKTFFSISR